MKIHRIFCTENLEDFLMLRNSYVRIPDMLKIFNNRNLYKGVKVILHMLKIFNDLKPFFEDNYRRINIREYARTTNISPPSASKLLDYFRNQGLLKMEKDKNYIYYVANKNSKIFIELSRTYWHQLIEKTGIFDYLEKELLNPLIILFGSFSKAEVTNSSDIDLAIFSISKKSVNLEKFEKKLNRKIQSFSYKSKEEVKNKGLLNNIFNGFVLRGSW
ncbi:hypothetical protein COV15_01785 [Candidatus Woesearchaeota archaeon CG10_big_fil_rev_8_21_14_0_10_34_12]|nr:MAG: hypothetical protein COV15_01785 [Candidatus Woesearchaeota archaeon CG10_big_fil_rev_8_21_14_0_10_34_12]